MAINDYLMNVLGAEDEDTKIAAATDVLIKIAEEEGVDLSQLSEDELGGLISEMMGEAPEGDEPKTASSESDKVAQLTDAALVLVKVAEENGVDLTKLSAEERAEALAMTVEALEQQTSPEYQAKLAEHQEKLAEADIIGRAMAHGFHDELMRIKTSMDLDEDSWKRMSEAASKKPASERAKELAAKGREAADKGLEWAKAHKKELGIAGGTTVGGAAAIYGGHKAYKAYKAWKARKAEREARESKD